MMRQTFSLDGIIFERVSASSALRRTDLPRNFQLDFQVQTIESVDEEKDSFVIRISVSLHEVVEDEKIEVLTATAQGFFHFFEGIDPYELEEQIERELATNMLYCNMRPTLTMLAKQLGLPIKFEFPLGVPPNTLDFASANKNTGES